MIGHPQVRLGIWNWDMALAGPTIEYNGQDHRTPLEARWAFVFNLLGISYRSAPISVSLPDGGSFIPSFSLPSMNCSFEAPLAPPTKHERDGLEQNV